MKKWTVTIHGKTYAVELPSRLPTDGRVKVRLNGEPLELHWRARDRHVAFTESGEDGCERNVSLRGAQLRKPDGDPETKVNAALLSGGRATPRYFEAAVRPDVPGQASRVQAQAEKSVTIRSQLTGTVLRLGLSEGAHVRPGDVLMVIEAMKMENRVLAEKEGIIKSFYVGPGDSVQTGKELVQIDPPAAVGEGSKG